MLRLSSLVLRYPSSIQNWYEQQNLMDFDLYMNIFSKLLQRLFFTWHFAFSRLHELIKFEVNNHFVSKLIQ